MSWRHAAPSDPRPRAHRGPDRAFGLSLAAGGATTVAGGAALLALGILDPEDQPSAGRSRSAAGGMALSLGAGMAVTGAVGLASDVDEDQMGALITVGALTGAVGVPILAWGAGTSDDVEPDTEYVSEGRMVVGLVLTSIGVVSTASAVLIEARPCGGDLCGLRGIISVPLFLTGVTGISLGAPLYASGANVEPVVVEVGAGSIQATWAFH